MAKLNYNKSVNGVVISKCGRVEISRVDSIYGKYVMRYNNNEMGYWNTLSDAKQRAQIEYYSEVNRRK